MSKVSQGERFSVHLEQTRASEEKPATRHKSFAEPVGWGGGSGNMSRGSEHHRMAHMAARSRVDDGDDDRGRQING